MSLQSERIYYTDSYLREFTSVVEACQGRDRQFWVRLRESAFYPASGGQPYDTGTIQVEGDAAEITVGEVQVEDGQVWHRVANPLLAGQAVTGRIDWSRRFDFMQQHSGQHILSACFERRLGAHTTSFHMGDTMSDIELDIASLSDAKVQDVMREANRWIWLDVPIRARIVSEDALDSLQLRKAPSVTEDIRIVTIEGLEDNACGGTHPSSTGQVGQILITKTERMRGGVRVTFVCGERALATAKEAVDALRSLATTLSVGSGDLSSALESLQYQLKESNRQHNTVRGQYLSLLARDDVLRQAKVIAGTRVLVCVAPEVSEVTDLKRLAGAAAEWMEADHPGEPQLIAVAVNLGGRTHLVVQATEGAVAGADVIVKEVLPALGGKGGGNAKSAQGSAPAPAEDVVAAAESVLAER